jgi:hypothetical protein
MFWTHNHWLSPSTTSGGVSGVQDWVFTALYSFFFPADQQFSVFVRFPVHRFTARIYLSLFCEQKATGTNESDKHHDMER